MKGAYKRGGVYTSDVEGMKTEQLGEANDRDKANAKVVVDLLDKTSSLESRIELMAQFLASQRQAEAIGSLLELKPGLITKGSEV